MNRCLVCGTSLDTSPQHDIPGCYRTQADAMHAAGQQARDRAREHGLSISRATRIVVVLAYEIPPHALQAAALAAIDAWATTEQGDQP